MLLLHAFSFFFFYFSVSAVIAAQNEKQKGKVVNEP
jgi:hypothetical protein